MYRIIGADQKEYGPVSADEIRQWIAEGRANAQSIAQSESVPGWKPLADFPEFTAALSAASRTPAPIPAYPVAGSVGTRTNGMAVAGFICSLLSFSCCCFGIGIFPSILGLVFSVIGLVQTGRDPMQGGRGFAIAGLILSVLGLLFSAVMFIFWLIGTVSQPH